MVAGDDVSISNCIKRALFCFDENTKVQITTIKEFENTIAKPATTCNNAVKKVNDKIVNQLFSFDLHSSNKLHF